MLTENGFSNSLKDAEKFLHHIYKRTLKPTVLVVYDREAYYSKFDHKLRLTFDKNLRYNLFPSMDKLYCDDNLKAALPGYFIFEVKFGHGFPNWLSNILTDFGLWRMALSKYTICLEKEKAFNPAHRRSLFGLANAFDPFHSYSGE